MVGIFTALIVLIAGCKDTAGTGEGKKVIEAFESLMSAFRDKDVNRLWKLCDKNTIQFFENFASQLDEARGLIERCYSEEEKPSVTKAILGHVVPSGASGKEVFAALIDPRALRAPSNPNSYAVEKVVVGGKKAFVMTKASEVFEFVQEDDGFKIPHFLEAVRRKPWYSTLMENLDTIRKSCVEKKEAENEKD